MIYELDEKTEATCENDGSKLRHYDGSLGYEAIYCPKCGKYWDVNGNIGYDKCFER